MPYDDDYDDDIDPNDDQPDQQAQQQRNPLRKTVRDLEKRARKADEEAQQRAAAETERDAAKRELAMLKAGIDLESGIGKFFAKSYDGESTVAAVKAAAEEIGLVKPPEPSVSLEEQQAHQRLADASAGAPPAGAGGDPVSEIKAVQIIDPRTGQWNLEGPQQVLDIAAKYGARIGNARPTKWTQGGNQNTPATAPLTD